jgi:RND family efflux transporter MFP subunit
MKNRYILLLSAAGILVWSSCGKSAKKSTVMPPTPVSLTEAKEANSLYYDNYQATVSAINIVELRAQVAGFITGIYFKEGDVVQKGQKLYEIDQRKYIAEVNQAQANLASANANLVKAQKDVDRYNMLLANDAVARQTVDQAQAAYLTSKGDVNVAKANLASAKTDLSYSVITAPFTGRIGISQVRLGSQVSIGTTLLNTISSEDPIAVNVVIDQSDIDRFYGFQSHPTDSTFKLQLSNGIIYKKPGKVLTIDRGVNDQTGTITVRVVFSNAKDTLKDGMSCVLQVINNGSGTHVQIPYKAVSEQMGEFFVFVARDSSYSDTDKNKKVQEVKDTIALQHKVKLGPRIGSNVVILSGLNSGDKVVTDGFQRLRDKGKITLGKPKAPAGAGGGAKQ